MPAPALIVVEPSPTGAAAAAASLSLRDEMWRESPVKLTERLWLVKPARRGCGFRDSHDIGQAPDFLAVSSAR